MHTATPPPPRFPHATGLPPTQTNSGNSGTQRFGGHSSVSPRGHTVASFSSSGPASPANGLLHHHPAVSSYTQQTARTTLPSADGLVAAAANASSPRQAPDGWSSGAGGGGGGSSDARVQQAWSSRMGGTGAGGSIGGGGGALPHGGAGQMPSRGSQRAQVRPFATLMLFGVSTVRRSVSSWAWSPFVRTAGWGRPTAAAAGSDRFACFWPMLRASSAGRSRQKKLMSYVFLTRPEP